MLLYENNVKIGLIYNEMKLNKTDYISINLILQKLHEIIIIGMTMRMSFGRVPVVRIRYTERSFGYLSE